MRTLELSTHVKPISRSDGRSATAAAAYRACCIVECEREGRIHDYTHKAGLELAAIVLPAGAPRWAKDRAKLWNAAELVERNGKRGKNAGAFKANAQTAREFFFTFPFELSPEGRLKVAEAVARHLADTHGIAVDFAIHRPGKDGDNRNYHCHMLTTTRRLNAKGLGEKAREWDDLLTTGPKLTKAFRAFVAGLLNDELKAEGKAEAVFVEHRSFKARGSGQTPTRHLGVKTHSIRRAKGRARKAWTAEQGKAQAKRHGKELASLKLRQDFALQGKLADLARRQREGIAAIKREFQAQRRADGPPTGLRRVFLMVTGRAGREAFDRQARDAQHRAEAKQKVSALKAGLQAERNAFINSQTKDRAAVIERHGQEDRQLTQTAIARELADKAAERTARQPEAKTRTNEQEQQRGRGRGWEPAP